MERRSWGGLDLAAIEVNCYKTLANGQGLLTFFHSLVSFCGTLPMPPLPLLAVFRQLNFGNAESFLTKATPTLEGVESQGDNILVKVTPDGNCFPAAEATGALMWAVSKPGSSAIKGFLWRFRDTFGSSGKIAYSALSEEMKVGVFLTTHARMFFFFFICLHGCRRYRCRTLPNASYPN